MKIYQIRRFEVGQVNHGYDWVRLEARDAMDAYRASGFQARPGYTIEVSEFSANPEEGPIYIDGADRVLHA